VSSCSGDHSNCASGTFGKPGYIIHYSDHSKGQAHGDYDAMTLVLVCCQRSSPAEGAYDRSQQLMYLVGSSTSGLC
jgi:hypothetical protein